MSGELGLANSFYRRVFRPLQEYRGSDAAPGHEIDLIEFMQTRALNEDSKPVGLKNTSGQPIDWEDIWSDLGLDPAGANLNNLISYQGDDMKYLAPEMVRAFVLEGLEADANHMDLCAGQENVDSFLITAPWIEMQNETPQTVAEAERIPESGVTWGEKSVKLTKDAIAFHWTDELMLTVRLPLLRYWLRKVGARLAERLYTRAVTTLLNGDQADSSDVCSEIGVDSAGTIAFKDFLRAWLRGRRIGQRWETLIMNEVTAFDVFQISEFSDPQGAGSVVTRLEQRNRIIPANMPSFITGVLDDNNVMLLNRAFGMLFLSMRGLMVESERIIMRQIQGTAASIISGFLTIDNNARLILDGDTAYSSKGFDLLTNMTPTV